MEQEEKGSDGAEVVSVEDIHLKLYPVEDESRKDIAKDNRVSEREWQKDEVCMCVICGFDESNLPCSITLHSLHLE